MKEMMKLHTCEPNMPSSALAMHKGSHVISKFQPKIRIVHIFAPEIIKTDVTNFRELVQRLTGKPTDHKRSKKKKAKSSVSREDQSLMISSFKPIKTRDLQDGSQRIKEEDEGEMWGGENSTGFYSGLGDLDSFIQGLTEFPLIPSNSSHMDVLGLGETHL